MRFAVIAGLLLTACATVPKTPTDPNPCLTQFQQIRQQQGRAPDYQISSRNVLTFYYQKVSNGVTTREHYTLTTRYVADEAFCLPTSSTEVLRSQN